MSRVEVAVEFRNDGIMLNGLPHPVSINEYANRRYPTDLKKRYDMNFRNWMLSLETQKLDVRTVNGVQKWSYRKAVCRKLFGNRYQDFKERRALAIVPIMHHWYRMNVIRDKNGHRKIRREDPSNYMKLTEDKIAEFLGIDDCYFKHSHMMCKNVWGKQEERYSVELFPVQEIADA